MKKWNRVLAVLLIVCLTATMCACSGSGIDTADNVIVNTEGMTDEQKAVVITAESYYLRGSRVQYDQTSYNKTTSRKVNRRSTATYKPEAYTTQFFGYHDCSSFVFDVYWNALGMDFSEGPTKRNTKYFMENPHAVLKEKPQTEWTNYTAEQIEEKKQAFLNALQPGDVIVYRKRGNGSGHAMLYLGNDQLLHSQGGDYAGAFETYEKSGTYTLDKLSELLMDVGSARYLFNKHSYTILRPLDAFEGEIPADTVARMGDMRGIMAEKLASHTLGQTVSVGGEVTFTFLMDNRSTAEKTLTVTDTVPAGTTYVSGADTVDGSTLSWTVTVPAGEVKEVSYTVKVNEGTTLVESSSTISGVEVNCPAIPVANTLTEEQQQAVLAALEKHKSKATGLAVADAVYREVLGYEKLGGMTAAELLDKLYVDWNETDMDLDAKSELAGTVVPRLYGGMNVVEQVKNDAYRVRLLQAQHLIVGDIIVADEEAYLFTGDAVVNLDNGTAMELSTLEWFVGYFAFAVVRPSMDV